MIKKPSGDKQVNVLSLFDGMSCGQLALNHLGIKVDKYYASEIDKYAIKVTQANFPDTIQVGDICNLDPKDFMDVSLIIAGSPCQGFSFAGNQLAFDDPRSALFFEFIRLLKEIKPKYFLLENVKMKKEFLNVITEQVSACYPDYQQHYQNYDLFGGKIDPILINSALLSAQNRERYYWTNIPGVEQPEQKGIVLKDILETGNISQEYKYSQKAIDYMNRGNEKWKTTRRSDKYQQTPDKEKSFTVTANWYKGIPYNFFKDDINTLENEDKEFDKNLDRMTNKEGKAYCLTARYDGAVAWNSLEKKQRTMIPVVQETHDTPKCVGTASDIEGHDILKRVYSPDGKSPTLLAGDAKPKIAVNSCGEAITEETKKLRRESKQKTGKDYIAEELFELVPIEDGRIGMKPGFKKLPDSDKPIQKDSVVTVKSFNRKDGLGKDLEKAYTLNWRKLTCVEAERLQTVPDNYTNHVSNSQRYKMLGNSFTVLVISHILRGIKDA